MTVTILGRRFPAAVTYAVGLAIALLLLIVAVVTAFTQSNLATDLNSHVRVSIDRRAHYRAILQLTTDAETSQRGFLITSDPAYLGPFNAARPQIEREIVALNNQPDSARIRDLVQRKFDELSLTIALKQHGRQSEALLIVNSNTGKATMDALRAAIDGAVDRENATLNTQLGTADQTARQLRFIILLAGLLIVGIGATLVFSTRAAIRELQESRDRTREAHQRALQEMHVREQAEEKVRQMQKLEAIGQLTGGVAHDFNNMLAVIISALQLAKRRIQKQEAGVEGFIDNAVDAAKRAAALTSRLLAFARRSPLSPASLDANRVLGDMSDLLRRTLGEHIELETVLTAGAWRVLADRQELEQAIVNVCVNARDAMPGGGKLTIETSNAHLDEAYARANAEVTPGQYVLIAITDTGEGMSEEVRHKAFEPFFTTKDVGKGTGLGLSHVHGFLKQSGGHVSIYSEVGHGTTVKLYLPRTRAAEAEEEAPQTDGGLEAYPGDPGTIILVVEDDERVRALSVATLRELGYTVLHAASGAAALDKLEANPSVNLLFTDVVMPEMTGRVLAEEARRRHPEIKVLYTTGYTQNAIVHNGVVDADARLLLKPYALSELARKVRTILDEK